MKRFGLFLGMLILTTITQAQVDSTDVFIYGCTDPLALNYNPQANMNDGSCVYDNGDSTDFFIYGCTDPLALNYNPQANVDDGSCVYDNGDSTDFFIYGCTDPLALNYNPQANVDDGSCVYDNGDSIFVFIYGCTDPQALNYNPLATISDDSCLYQDDNITYGCTDPLANNYNSDAQIDDGSCTYDNWDGNCNAAFEVMMDSVNCENVIVNNLSTGNGLSYIWELNGSPISYEHNFELQVTAGWEYELCLSVFDPDSCYTFTCQMLDLTNCDTETGDVWVQGMGILPLSVEQEEEQEQEVVIFPNPVRDQLNVQLFNEHRFERWSVIAINGAMILQGSVNTSERLTLDTDILTKGMYFLILEAENEIRTQRFIKE